MMTGMAAIADFVQPLIGLPCWRAKRGYSAFLTFDFGEPKLQIREPHEASAATSERTRRWLAQRTVSVHGSWHLWIYLAEWLACQDDRPLATSRSPYGRINQTIGELQGQALTDVMVTPNGRRTAFRFDQGGALIARAKDYSRADAELAADPWWRVWSEEPHNMWLLSNPDGLYATVRDDGRYSIHSGDTAPEQAVWLPLA